MDAEAQHTDADSESLVVFQRSKDDKTKQGVKRPFQQRRKGRACGPCRVRKTRCDTQLDEAGNPLPCKSCEGASILCHFPDENEDLKRKVGPARRVRQLEATVQELSQKLEVAEGKLRSIDPERSPQDISPSTTTSFNTEYLAPSRAGSFSANLPSHDSYLYSIKSEDEQSIRRGSMHMVDDEGSSQQYFGPTSGPAFDNSIQSFVEGLGYRPSTSWKQFGKRTPPVVSPTQKPGDLDLRTILPPKDVGKKLFEIYKTSLQRYMPMLYWPDTMEKFHQAYSAPIMQSDEPAVTGLFCFCMIVMAFSCLCSDDDDETPAATDDPEKRGWHYYLAARKYHDLDKPRYHLHDVVVLTIMTLYLDGVALASPSWMMVGSLARVCQDIGLHLKPPSGKYTATEMESRARIFWGAYCLDRKAALHFGRAPSFIDEDIEIEFPGSYEIGGVEEEIYPEKMPIGLQVARVVSQNAKFNASVVKLDLGPGGEEALDQKINDIEERMSKLELKLPKTYTDGHDNEPIDPPVIKFLFHILSTRLSMYRFFTDTTLSHSFRTKCLIKSLDIARSSVHVLRRMMKYSNWEKGFRLHQSELVYQHTFKVAMVFLLSSNLFDQEQVNVDAPGNISICIEALKQAAYAHKTPATNLEKFHMFANVLGFDPLPTAFTNTSQSSGQSSKGTYTPVTKHYTSDSSQYSQEELINRPATTQGPSYMPQMTTLITALPSSSSVHKPTPSVSSNMYWETTREWPTQYDLIGSNVTSTDYTAQVPTDSVHWPENVGDVEWGIFENVLSNETQSNNAVHTTSIASTQHQQQHQQEQ